MDGPALPSARLLLPRDRAQPPDRRAVREPRCDLRGRHRRGPRGGPADALGPRVGTRDRGRGPRPRPVRGERRVPARDQGAPRGPRPGREGLHDSLRGPRRPRRGGRDPGRGAGRDPPRGARRGPRSRPRRGARPRACGAARTDHPRAARLGGNRGRRARALSRALDRHPQRPLLRHHQPTVGALGHRGPGRRSGRDRERELVEHDRARQGRRDRGVPERPAHRRSAGAGARDPRRRRRSSASPPAPAHRRTRCRP